MEIEIQLKKKQVIILFAIGLFVFSLGFVFAYHSSFAPNIFGHQGPGIEIVVAGNTTTLQQAIDANLLFNSSSSFSSADMGIVPTSQGSKNIGANRDCVAFVQTFVRSGPIAVTCVYNKNTGVVSGSYSIGGDVVICGYICKNGS